MRGGLISKGDSQNILALIEGRRTKNDGKRARGTLGHASGLRVFKTEALKPKKKPELIKGPT